MIRIQITRKTETKQQLNSKLKILAHRKINCSYLLFTLISINFVKYFHCNISLKIINCQQAIMCKGYN